MSTYEAAASLSEFKITKILIDKMEKNKSYDKADYKKKLYDALVESYNTDKDLFDSYGEVFSMKRSRDDSDKDRDPSARSDQGKKRRKSSNDVSAHAEEPSYTVEDSGIQQDQEFVTRDNDEQPADKEVTKANWFKKPERPPTPDPDWNLEYLKGRDLSRRYSTSVTKTKAATYDLKWIEDLVNNLWSPVQVKYDQHAYLGTSHWGLKRQRSTEEIKVRRDDQKLYTFKEGDFKRLRLQDIEDMLLLLVQQKLANLTIDERYSLNVALRIFTRQIVIQRRVEDLQLGVKSYQKKLNLTKPDTFRSNTFWKSYGPHYFVEHY
ncbi:hypothetical protein Tco_0337137 [Tanacetum coccineum]